MCEPASTVARECANGFVETALKLHRSHGHQYHKILSERTYLVQLSTANGKNANHQPTTNTSSSSRFASGNPDETPLYPQSPRPRSHAESVQGRSREPAASWTLDGTPRTRPLHPISHITLSGKTYDISYRMFSPHPTAHSPAEPSPGRTQLETHETRRLATTDERRRIGRRNTIYEL